MRFPARPYPGLALVLGLTVFVPASTATAAEDTTLTAAEVQALLNETRQASQPPGSFRAVGTRTTRTSTTTTTTLTKRAPGQPVLRRTESVTVRKKDPKHPTIRLTLQNAEGSWQIIGSKAVLMPELVDTRAMFDAIVSAKGASPATTPVEPKSADPAIRRLAAQSLTIAKHTQLSGERYLEGDQPRVRISRTTDAEGQRAMRELVDDQLAKVKKQLSFGKRLLLSAAMAMIGDLDSKIPSRDVTIIDPTTKRVLSTESFNAAGKSVAKRGPPAELEKVDDLPPETFQLPPGVEKLRPKTLGEALELTEKLREEERKKTKDDDPSDAQ